MASCSVLTLPVICLLLPLGSFCQEDGPGPEGACPADGTEEEGCPPPSVMLLQTKARVHAPRHVDKPPPGAEKERGTLRRAPCECVPNSTAWKRPARTAPLSVFIDLGAADGNSFKEYYSSHKFVKQGDPRWKAILVEANPIFTSALNAESKRHAGKIELQIGKAAFSCKARVPFLIDHDKTHNYWGSNIGGVTRRTSDWNNKNDMSHVYGRKKHNVTMSSMDTFNVVQFLYENTIPGDQVTVKMDIEGAEWDILPCLARSAPEALPKTMYVETHPANWQLGRTTPTELEAAKQKLRDHGVNFQDIFSSTLLLDVTANENATLTENVTEQESTAMKENVN